ncbi:hypothetical protein GGI12_004465 [Dipsacomyces acuminosporus]|nr:hypothetical protein GGI12_004465 [Dipsacomyces acuminosporus]
MYSLYLRNFSSALSDISQKLSSNAAFASFIQKANASPDCKGLSFQSYLLLPVQRIPRYKLLLEDLLKHTPQSHIDHRNIEGALRTIEEVAAFVNENIQEHEMTMNIIEIQRTLGLKETLLIPGRRLIKVGTLMKICRKNHQPRRFYLFSDILLYTSAPAALIDDQAGHRKVPLEDCKAMGVPDTLDCRNQFTIISREKSFIVYTYTSHEKAEWMQALAKAITERRAACETLQMDNSLKRRIARARRSTMLQFPRVAENFDAPVWDPDESTEECYICFREFSLFVRKHHCRACGKIVCNSCSRKNIMFVGRTSTETKEGRGCDQCIARLFGREALESPPGTLHRLISKSRHSLDPSALFQNLTALASTANSASTSVAATAQKAELADSDPRSTCSTKPGIKVAPAIEHASYGQLSSTTLSASQLNVQHSPAIREAQAAGPSAGGDNAQTAGLPDQFEFYYSPNASSDFHPSPRPEQDMQAPLSEDGSDNGMPSRLSLGSEGISGMDSRPLSTAAAASLFQSAIRQRGSSASDLASSPTSREFRSRNRSFLFTRNAAKHASTGSTVDWECMPFSARSTLSYESSLPATTAASAHSPESTVSRNRISFVSSSCSTIVSDSSLRFSRTKARHPILFATKEPSMQEPVRQLSRSSTDHGRPGMPFSSSATIYEDHATPPLPLSSCLVSSVAPPKVTLAQAEATAIRKRGDMNATLCSLCHGDFTLLDSQHQCTSCLSLVCSKCVNFRPPPQKSDAPNTQQFTAQPPSSSRILSMYIPDGYSHNLAGDLLCDSCVGGAKNRYKQHSGDTDSNQSRRHIYPFNTHV